MIRNSGVAIRVGRDGQALSAVLTFGGTGCTALPKIFCWPSTSPLWTLDGAAWFCGRGPAIGAGAPSRRNTGRGRPASSK